MSNQTKTRGFNLMKKLQAFKKPLMGAIAAALLATTTAASAEVTGSFDVASKYLFRGLDADAGNANVSGSIDYSHDSGAYAGIWASSTAGAGEQDYYVGYAGEAGDFGYDVAYIDYNYQDTAGTGKESDTDLEELYIGLSFNDFSFDTYMGVGSLGHNTNSAITERTIDNNNNYYAFGYSMDQVSVTYGMTDNDLDQTDYTHLDVSYAINDNLTFTASKILSAGDCAANGNSSYTNINTTNPRASDNPADDLRCNKNFGADGHGLDNTADDLQFVVSYGFDI